MNFMKIEDKKFFTKEADVLAKELLGKILCRKTEDGRELRFRITETEAYGKDDPFCHANAYKSGNSYTTQRKVGGTVYIHTKTKDGSMFDIVSGDAGVGEGVLIRSAVDLGTGKEVKGPLNLGQALEMTFDLNQQHLTESDRIRLEKDEDSVISSDRIKSSHRVGLTIKSGESSERIQNKLKFLNLPLNFKF